MAKRTSFPCPYCKGRGGERGGWDGPDVPCGGCGMGWGFIEIDSPEHDNIRVWAIINAACRVLPEGYIIEGVEQKSIELLRWVKTNMKKDELNAY